MLFRSVPIPDIVQDANPDILDNVQVLPVQNEELIPEVQTQKPQEDMSLWRSTRERRNAIPDDYIVFLQEREFDIWIVEDDPINFHQAKQSSNSQKWINAINDEVKSMKDNDIWDFIELLEGTKPIG